MTHITANMFHIRKFLCFFSLRAGTILLLHFIFISALYFLLFLFTLTRLVGSAASKYPTLFIEGIILIEIILSFFALLFFPKMHEKYEKNSINVRCIKYFTIYNILVAGIIFMSLFLGSFLLLEYPKGWGKFGQYMFYGFIATGVIAHIVAVTYSFYLSILRPNKFLEYEDLITNNTNTSALGKHLIPAVLPLKSGKAEGSSSSNDVYVDIPS